MTLTPEERDLIKDLIDRGEPLPDDYRFRLFREPREAELIWPGKTHEVTQAVLPFQSIEQIDEPRFETEHAYGGDDLFSLGKGGRQAAGWSNKLIWGDNKLVLSSLKGGPLRKQIEDAGGLKLVYIDPPFDVGADFSFQIDVGERDRLEKAPTVIEDIAYRDTWGRGQDSYASMLLERLKLIKLLMSKDSSIYLHCDYRVSASIRCIMDEVFGKDSFDTEIIWKSTTAHANNKTYGSIHQTILFYQLGSPTFNTQRVAYDEEYVETYYRYKDDDGRAFMSSDLVGHRGVNKEYEWKGIVRPWRYPEHRLNELDSAGQIFWTKNGFPRFKRYLDLMDGMPAQSIWVDKEVKNVRSWDRENLEYATQKPEALVARLMEASSEPGDLIADFFCGSGTTLSVAEKLGRKWIGADLGRFAIHTSRKRLIGVQRQLKAEGKPYRSFEILNLGKYERQWFVGVDPSLPEDQRRAVSADKEARYLALILQSYQAQPLDQTPPFHGTKQGAFVLVGPVDAPVTESQVADAVEAARRLNISRIDVLGFEFEMGLSPRAVDEARAKGVAVALRAIPKDVFDRRAVEKGQVTFHDLAYVEAKAVVVSKKDRSVTISLTNFGVNYRQEDVDALVAGLGKNKSKVTVDGGQVVKITTDKEGVVTREVLTKEWTDWIDYWAVDFDYHSRPETIVETINLPDGAAKHVPQWTGGYIFENEWQSFRTKRDRKLELTSASHTYDRNGRHVVAVKVIDIFGNDTTKVFGVEV
ncbi:site-specific DNA-methyltransferase [soil metagenome]